MKSAGEWGSGPRFDAARSFLAKYQPFIITVTAIALIALFLPGRGNQSTAGNTASEISTNAPQAAQVSAGSLTRSPTAVGAAKPTSVQAAPLNPNVLTFQQAKQRGVALVKNCDSKTTRIMIPSWSAPPCVQAFNGNNGGTTYQGVTKDKIVVAVYLAQDNPAADAILKAAGASDSKEQTIQQYKDWVKFYEATFNTWGRHVELHFVDGTGDSNDTQAARADAINVATQIKAFASWNYPNLTYVDELVSRGVMDFGPVEFPNALYQRWAPYVWATLQTADQTYQLLEEYMLKRLVNRPAQWSGDVDLKLKKRVFGLLQYDTHDYVYKSAAVWLKGELAKRGIALKVVYFNGYPNLDENQEQARPAISAMKEAHVSTIICGCDPFAPIFFSQEATRQQYHPEWLVVGSALTDTSFFGRTYDPTQWSHAFGLGQLTARLPETLSDSYRLLQWYFHREPSAPAGYGVIRANIDLFYHGVHMAGPVLNPKTFQAGMFAQPVIGRNMKTVPTSSFGRGVWNFNDYTAFDDVTEIWWDPTARGKDEIGNDKLQGMYRYVLGGKRYVPGEWPTTNPHVFDTADKGAITVYNTYPPGEAPPTYPSPTK